MPESTLPTNVQIGDTHVTIKRSGRTGTTTAMILGREETTEGTLIWLDRVVHHGRSEAFTDGWHGEGAVVTVLSQTQPVPGANQGEPKPA